MELKVSFSPESLAIMERIREFANFDAVLEPAFRKAMDTSTSMMQAFASDYMWSHFNNPTGPLEDAMQSETISGYQGVVWNESPYAFRREYGFSGKTDSLGRFFPHDPGIAYMQQTMILLQYKVLEQFEIMAEQALKQLSTGAGGTP